MFRRQYLLGTAAAIIILVAIFFKLGLNLYVDWLWYSSLNFGQVFWTTLTSKLAVRAVAGLWLFLFLLVNLLLTRGAVLKRVRQRTGDDETVVPLQSYYLDRLVTPGRLLLVFLAASLVYALLFSSIGAGQWLTVQQYLHSQSFGITDPLFNKDVGFYVFQLPLYEFVLSLLMFSFLSGTVAVGAVHFFADPNQFRRGSGFTGGKLHLSLLAAGILLLKAGDYFLSQYALTLSPRGVAFGASYADIHAQLPALKILTIIALVSAALVLVNVFLRKIHWVIAGVLLLVVASVVLGGIFPALMQKFIVEPDEFRKEEPYLEDNIALTRRAFALDQINASFFPLDNQLASGQLEANQGTLTNVRLWDWRPLQQTYSQLQEIRPYYNFSEVDVDRYQVDGELKQVMLSARELNQEQLDPQAKSWINEKLRYTHGYGIVMSPVSAITEEGLPSFYLKDIPPMATVGGVEVTRPQLYFGEQTDTYVFVNTETKEFDYSSASSENVETTYEAKSGIRVGSIFRRLLLAAYFGDYKILLAGDLNSDSQLLMRRNISERIREIMPILRYDRDPYLVVADGNLYWMQDAYTVSDRFPYSEPIGGINYIRNSVKIVVNAYDGTVQFYAVRPDEPVLNSYMGIYPGVFQPMEQMPVSLREHIRYPQDIFWLQAQQYTAYHMTDTQNFYNKEDQWSLPNEIVGSDTQPMEPYYVVMSLPEEAEPEYLLMLPFTPAKKLNMTSWLAVRNSPEHFGEMLNYAFTRNQLVFGPMQIEARIDQDSEISSQLTLWNQRGSEIIRGNLMVLPVENSILYVEPIFIQGEQSRLPELRRVVVAYRDQIVMEKTFEAALAQVFNLAPDQEQQPPVQDEPEPQPEPQPQPQPGEPTRPQTVQQLIGTANRLFSQAQEALRQGDWAGYGETISQLESILARLEQETNAVPEDNQEQPAQ